MSCNLTILNAHFHTWCKLCAITFDRTKYQLYRIWQTMCTSCKCKPAILLCMFSVQKLHKVLSTTGFELMHHDSGNTIYFSFFTIVSPTIPENHDNKISFCFLKGDKKTNLFLALRLKTISIRCMSCFLLNSEAVAILT